MIFRCEECGDGFSPDESSDLTFCSWDCREAYQDRIDMEIAYWEARNSGAPVF